MAVFRIEKTRDYTVMSNYHLRDMSLSLKAKGLLSLMLSLPENWDYTMKGLARICKDGIDSISGGIRELEAHGYLIRSRVRSANEQLGSIEYTILEQPKAPSPTQEKPIRENPVQANPSFSHPCHVKSHDEFGQLAESLNTMAKNLQQAFSSLEDANRKLEQDVEQKKRLLAERKELVDNLSHEMKTPLGVIRAYAEGLQDETDEAKRQKYSEVIITETERMSRLITTLLDLSALENGATQLRPERFDFVDFLETVAGRLLIDTPDADFVLEYELPEHPVYVNTDKGRMEQVLNNLIVNAKRNNRPGGILRLSLLEKDGLLNFSIFNQGAPIPEESLSKIWSKFYRDKNSKYSGSGLGLAIVAQVLSMQHLHYGAENQPGGVAFYFSLPTVK